MTLFLLDFNNIKKNIKSQNNLLTIEINNICLLHKMSKKRNKNYNNDGLNQIQPMHKNNNYFYFFIQIIFSFLLTYQIINNNIYQSYNTMLQLVSYLIIYNLTFLIFYNFQYHILQQKTLNIMYWVLGLSIIYVYIISYYPVLELNGDNAAYLSRAKSIMEGKGFRNLWLPKEPFESTLKGIGFSLLNIPFVFIFGLNNYIGLNLLEFFSVFIGLFFMYKFFKNKLDKDKLFLLIIIVALYSQIIHFTFNQMTESASFALMFITMYLAEKYINNDEKFKLKKIVFIFLISAIAFFSFTVREAMVAIIITIPLYLLVHKKWKETIIFGLFTIIYFLGYFFLSNHLKSLNDLYQFIASLLSRATLPSRSKARMRIPGSRARRSAPRVALMMPPPTSATSVSPLLKKSRDMHHLTSLSVST